MHAYFRRLAAVVVLLSLGASSAAVAGGPQHRIHQPVVRMITNMGTVDIQLFPDKAPVTVKNFLHYVDSGFYNGTIFHRVIPGFMIQGGGFLPGMRQKPTDAPITNEAGNGLRNTIGTVAMARTEDPDSATAQFFINTADNAFLDHRNDTVSGWGYAVFGKVIRGMGVVRKIESVPTGDRGPYQDVPLRDVVILKMAVAGHH